MKVLRKEAFASGEEPDSAAGQRPKDDPRLLQKLLDGDAEAFWALVEHHHAGMLRFAGLFVSSPALAEEVVQETWLAVLDGLRSFEGRSSLKGWIFRILANRAKTRAVREGRSVPFSSLAEPEDEAGEEARFDASGHWRSAPSLWTEDTPERLLLQKEAIAHVMRAIDGLAPQQRAVLTLRDMEGLPSPEICNILEISETNQRVLLHRAPHIVEVKFGIFRRLLLQFVLRAIDFLARHYFNKGNLGGIPTIHFARWVLVEKKRLLFFSNYDGSWENYLGDFIDQASEGLTGVWSNTKNFPKTFLLFLFGGSRKEEAFKQWTRDHQIPSQLWYSAHTDESVLNILNNIEICAQLKSPLAGKELTEWLQRL